MTGAAVGKPGIQIARGLFFHVFHLLAFLSYVMYSCISEPGFRSSRWIWKGIHVWSILVVENLRGSGKPANHQVLLWCSWCAVCWWAGERIAGQFVNKITVESWKEDFPDIPLNARAMWDYHDISWHIMACLGRNASNTLTRKIVRQTDR